MVNYLTFTRRFLIPAVLYLFTYQGICQDIPTTKFYIDVPTFEYPFNVNDRFRSFSMQQSLRLTKSFYYTAHYGIESGSIRYLGKKGKLWSRIFISVFDFIPLPLSNTWMHEEWHRTVLSVHGFQSKNSFWKGMVTNVKDSDLILLKENSAPDMVRAATAGIESHYEFVTELQKDQFFNQSNSWNYSLYWGSYIVNSAYILTSVYNQKGLKKFKEGEDQNILKRDANGYDPVNAVYDLFNPLEDYSLRGTHPSGAGIDRYVEFDDLTPEAQRFLKLQSKLSFLNFLDPNLFGLHEFGNQLKWSISIRHQMTSFGYMISSNLLLKDNEWGLVLAPQYFRNYQKNYPGLSTELRGSWLRLKIAGWLQPDNQGFYDSQGRMGGLFELFVSPFKNKLRPYAEISLKSAGWVAGNPYLDRNFTCRIGLTWCPPL